MIKKVRTDQLRVGVYVHDFNCPGYGENKYITQALLQTEHSIHIIRSWGIEEVFIDTEKGLDIIPGQSVFEVRQKIDKDLRRLALAHQPEPSLIPLHQEIDKARTIAHDARKTIQHAIAAVEKEKRLELEVAYHLLDQMSQSVARNRDALLLLTRIKKKDEYTLMHSIGVCSMALAFSNYCGLKQETAINIAMGALFHDIGKTKIPITILNKPDKLNTYEQTIIRKHTEHSTDVLANAKNLPFEAFDIALHHHERHDGSGYPHGLRKDSIGFSAKIASLCDVYDAITSDRCYKQSLSRIAGLRKMYEWSETLFDKELAYKFIGFIGVYPVGTCVSLENGLVGVVSGSTGNILRPMVRIFYNDKTKTAIKVYEIDLSTENIEIVGYETPATWDPGKLRVYNSLKFLLDPLTPL